MKRAAFLSLILFLTISVSVWLFWPQVTGWLEFRQGVAAIKKHTPDSSVIERRSFGANTFTHQFSSTTIERYYNLAAKMLNQHKTGTCTYYWEDSMGWPRISTVFQAERHYVEVRASQNNDNDSMAIIFSPNQFQVANAQKLDSYILPDTLLR